MVARGVRFSLDSYALIVDDAVSSRCIGSRRWLHRRHRRNAVDTDAKTPRPPRRASAWRPTPSTRRPRADDPDYDEEEALKNRRPRTSRSRRSARRCGSGTIWARRRYMSRRCGATSECVNGCSKDRSCDSVDPQDWTTGATLPGTPARPAS